MTDPSLYDEDILLWSEQQADAIRRLGQTRHDLSNVLDVENVAEEIESVGRSELAAVKSYIRLIFVHLIKLAVDEDQSSARHWRSEIVAFHSDLIGRYAPSMRQRIDIGELWRSAREQSLLAYDGILHQQVAALPVEPPFALSDMLTGRIDSFESAKILRNILRSQGLP